jgi:pilus assembly protein CpaB
MRAGTVRVDEEEARLAGLVKPGDHVDLMWLYSIPDTDDVKITTLLQNITVLAVGQTVQLQDPNQASPNQANQSNNAKEQNYTLLLTTQQYQKLALASSRGKIRLALRGKDDETTDEIGAISIRTLIPGMEPTSTDTLDLPHEREEFTIEYINAGGSRTEMIETPRRTHSHSHD